ncbi:MAG: hypothetical protein KAT37_02190 [Candidatus Aenigmarchaeota archaeon]|nr:hypothetical protein [Candidatus Aenigmarchaeota archaeon]
MKVDTCHWKDKSFTEFMKYFLDLSGYNENIVEIGSDTQLKLALDLSGHCNTIYSVDFEHSNSYKRGWCEMHSKRGINNIKLIDGNVKNLSSLIKNADLIFTRRVVLEYEAGDMKKHMSYERGEKELTKNEISQLKDNFQRAPKEVYEEFLRVANPGYLVLFNPADFETENTIKSLGLEENVVTVNLLAEPWKEVWPCVIVDNTNS